MGEYLGIGREHHVHMLEIAIDPDPLRGHHQEVGGRRPFFLRAILGVGADVKLAFPGGTVLPVTLLNEFTHGAEDFTHILPGGNHPPPPDGVEPYRDGVVRKKGRCLIGVHGVRMVDPHVEHAHPVRGPFPIDAGDAVQGEIVSPEDAFRTEITRAQAIDASKHTGHFCR